MTIRIPISGRRGAGLFALVSDEDAHLAAYVWHLDHEGYVRRSGCTGKAWPDSTRLMHRVVLEAMVGRQLGRDELGDHVRGNRLDNRRTKLRVTNFAGNSQNIRGNRRNSSGLRGATWNKNAGKWEASVRHRGRKLYLGLHASPALAAAVAARKRRELGFLAAGGAH